MKNKSCPFCQFNKETEFYYYDKWKNIIICRDKKDRLLAVRVDRRHHKPMPTYEERDELLKSLIAVAEAHIRNGKADGYKLDEVVKSDHYHYYCNFT